MKILHVMGNVLENSNGIGRLMPELLINQNKYLNASSVDLLLLNDQQLDNYEYSCYFYSQINIKFFSSYDLVVFHGLYFLKYIKIAAFLVVMGIPYLVKPHSSLMIESQKKSYFKKKIANFILFKHFLKHSKGIVFTSEGEKIRSHSYSSLTYVEPNGLELPDVLLGQRNAERTRFVYLGRLDMRHKGIDILLDSLFILKKEGFLDKFDFDFYGKGCIEDEQYFKQRLSALDSSTVNFYGPIYSPDKEIALSRSDVFVLTSRYEGVPMAILEALCQGVPCLVTPGTNIGESVSEWNFGWVVECDSYEIARKILAIINTNNDDLDNKRINARHYVEHIHAWPQVVKISESIFNSVIGI